MARTSVVLIIDVGKTNKKLLLFDAQYNLLLEETVRFEEIEDDDGFPCEDISRVANWITTSLEHLLNHALYEVKSINFSAYGASLVYVDDHLKPVAPLYNYLKPYPQDLLEAFYQRYGGKETFAAKTASPVLGSLNSGMQAVRLKEEQPDTFQKVKYILHLPQYISSIITHTPCNEVTGLGCHTNMWDFENNRYHEWITKEGLLSKLPPIEKSDACIKINKADKTLCVGIGLHDSSAALIPYLESFADPFVLISTGTWCITLNPFNDSPLTAEELKKDCLCYLSHKGSPVKASRLFAGHVHDQQVQRLAEHFHQSVDSYAELTLARPMIEPITASEIQQIIKTQTDPLAFSFPERGLSQYQDYTQAYHALVRDIVVRQIISTQLVLQAKTKKIFVDGGFSKNEMYLSLLANYFSSHELYAASVAQASALGAALIVHHHWNDQPMPTNLVTLKRYTPMDALKENHLHS